MLYIDVTPGYHSMTAPADPWHCHEVLSLTNSALTCAPGARNRQNRQHTWHLDPWKSSWLKEGYADDAMDAMQSHHTDVHDTVQRVTRPDQHRHAFVGIRTCPDLHRHALTRIDMPELA
jgi:hypothetical protein